MGGLKKYPSYKDSGHVWLGDIPNDWKTGGLTKYLSSIVDYRGKTPKKVKEGTFLVTARNIKNGLIDYKASQEFIDPDDFESVMSRGKPEIGDVLFTTEAPLGEAANVDRIDIALAQRVIKFRGRQELLNNYYLKYWINSHCFQENLKTYATGSTAKGIKASKLPNLVVLLPSIEEQKSIVNYIDEKVTEIDSLIIEKEKLIKLLDEQRQAIITEAVTKGLNPDVRMKDPEVKGIDCIPDKWSIVKLKYLTNHKMMYGANESAELDNRELPRYIRITDIDRVGNLREDTFRSLPVDKAENYLLSKGDLLFARSGATVGKTYFHNDDSDACFAGYLIKYSPNTKKVNPKFVYYYTQSSPYHQWIQENTIQATIQNVSAEKYSNLFLPLPSMNEQNDIVNFINEKINDIELIFKLIENQINKLKQYRQSLINEVVTGKIDVRDYKKVTL